MNLSQEYLRFNMLRALKDSSFCGLFILVIYCFPNSLFAQEAEFIPYDETSSNYRIVESGNHFKKRVFLTNVILSSIFWLDNRYIIATLGPDGLSAMIEAKHSNPTYKSYELGKIVLIDTQDGGIKDLGYEGFGKVVCSSGGIVIISPNSSNTDLADIYKVVLTESGVELKSIPRPKGSRINMFDCSFDDYKAPLDNPRKSLWRSVNLKAKDGLLVSEVDYDDVTPISRVYIEKPNGDRVDVHTNAGEANFEISYIPHENAYFVVPNLRNENGYIPYWKVHPRALFLRLLYPDSNVKRIPVPRLIENKIADQSSYSYRDVIYTKIGPIWSLTPRKRKSFQEQVFYLQTDDELIEFRDKVSLPSPDGCKVIGPYSDLMHDRFSNQNNLQNYYSIDFCEGKQ